MKFVLLVTMFLLLIYSSECRQITKTKRSLDYIDYIANKTSQLTNYGVRKTKELKDATVQTVNTALFSMSKYFSRGKKSLESGGLTVMEKLELYIDQAQNTASSLFDNIAPEETDFECSDQDPANQMTALQLITIHGYYAEAHTIVTDDGYILTIHRIPYSKNSEVASNKSVLLHHGFLGSSIDWVIPGARKSLPYMLSDAGYDVWMANVRGNTYSRAHVFRPADSAAFWNFSFHEVAQFDLPAVIDYIREYKGSKEKIDYIGFSMGTTVLFAMLSTKPQYNEVLRTGYTLAPVAFMTDIKSPFKIIARYGQTIEAFFKLIGAKEFLPRNAVVRYLSKHSCKVEDFHESFCEMSMFLLCGHNKNNFDRSLIPLIFGNIPAGASTKTLAHFAQEIRNDGRFQMYDYGEEKNMNLYKRLTPPDYPIDNITLPIVMISAEDDWLSSVVDAKLLLNKLPNAELHIVEDKTFDHLDFQFAKNARTIVYDKLLSMLKRRSTKSVMETNDIE